MIKFKIYLAIGAIFMLSMYPLLKLVSNKEKCEKKLLEFKEQESKVIDTIKTNEQQINVIKKKLIANPDREHRKQLLSQIFID